MRRRALLTCSAGLLAGLTGCSAFQTTDSELSLSFVNHTETMYSVDVGLYRTGHRPRSDARTYGRTIDVPATETVHREAVGETRPYLVRFQAYRNNSTLTHQDHVHYYPPDGEEPTTLVFDIGEDGIVTRR